VVAKQCLLGFPSFHEGSGRSIWGLSCGGRNLLVPWASDSSSQSTRDPAYVAVQHAPFLVNFDQGSGTVTDGPPLVL
jgi:hypothetical protein